MDILNQFFNSVQLITALTVIAVLLFIIAFKDDFRKGKREAK